MALGVIVFFAGCGSKGLSASDRAFIADLADQPKTQQSALENERQPVIATEEGEKRRKVTILVIHHTAGPASNDVGTLIPTISRLHGKRFKKMEPSMGLMISYHYLITPDGNVWPTRDENDIGHHAGDWEVNERSIALTLIGDFSKHRPTRRQVQSLDRLVRRLMSERRIQKVIPHSHCRATLCCGEYLSQEIRKLSWGEHF